MTQEYNIYKNENLLNEKVIIYNNDNISFNTALKYKVLKNKDNFLLINPNPFINNKQHIMNSIIRISIKEQSIYKRFFIIKQIKEIIYEKILKIDSLDYVYQISISDDLHLDFFVKVFNFPIDKKDLNKKDFYKILKEIQRKIIGYIESYVPELKNKLVSEKSIINSPYPLYPFIDKVSVLNCKKKAFLSDKNCLVYENIVNSVNAYLKTVNLRINDILYSYEDVEVKEVIKRALKWINFLVNQMNTNIQIFDYIPIVHEKETNNFIVGITTNQKDITSLKVLATELKQSLSYDKNSNIYYIDFFILMTDIYKIYKLSKKYNIYNETKSSLSIDLTFFRKFFVKKIKEKKVNEIFNKVKHSLYLFNISNEENELYYKVLRNKKIKLVKIKSIKDDLELKSFLQSVLKKDPILVEFAREDIKYLKEKIMTSIKRGEIKNIEEINNFGYWKDDKFINRSTKTIVTKYPFVFNRKAEDKVLLDNAVNSLNTHPALSYHFLIKNILVNQGKYLTDIIYSNTLDCNKFNQWSFNLMKIINPLYETLDLEYIFGLNSINNEMKEFSKNYGFVYFYDYPLKKVNIEKLNLFIGKTHGIYYKNIVDIKFNPFNIYIPINKDISYIYKFGVLKKESDIIFIKPYASNGYTIFKYNRENLKKMFSTLIVYCEEVVDYMKRQNVYFIDFYELLNYICNRFNYNFEEVKIYYDFLKKNSMERAINE